MNIFRQLVRLSLTKLLAGNASAQIIQFLALLLVARLYDPAQVGAYGLTVTLAAAVFPWAALRLESAIPLSTSEEESRSTAVTAFAAVILTSLASSAVIEVLRRLGALGTSANEQTAFAVGFLVLSASSITVLNQVAVRHERYGLLAMRPVLQQAITAVVQILSGFVFATWPALVGGQILGRVSAAALMIRATRPIVIQPSVRRIRSTLRKHRQFPLIFAPSTIINALGQQLPMLIAASFIGPTSLGGLSVAWQISLAPIALIATAVSDYFSGVLARRKRAAMPGSTQIYLRVSAAMLGLALVVVAAMIFIGPTLLVLVLGKDWALAATYLRVLSLVTGTCLVANSVTTVFTIHEGGRLFLTSNILRILIIATTALLLLPGAPSDMTVVTVLFTALALGYVLAWVLGLFVVRQADQRMRAR